MWNSRPDAYKINSGSEDELFQSLFLWNSRPDAVLETWGIILFIRFNPCFCGTRARTQENPLGIDTLSDVSILVFVELAPGLQKVRSKYRLKLRFNPCFCGTRARTVEGESGLGERVEFQSLFLWNSRPDGGDARQGGDRGDVSILVFVELAPGRR